MKCPECQFENPEDAQFCIECGNPIEFPCPKCGAITPATGKFCKAYGYDLRKPEEAPHLSPPRTAPLQRRIEMDVGGIYEPQHRTSLATQKPTAVDAPPQEGVSNSLW